MVTREEASGRRGSGKKEGRGEGGGKEDDEGLGEKDYRILLRNACPR